MSASATRAAKRRRDAADKSPSIAEAFDGETMTMEVPGARQMRHSLTIYPRTWRWLFWHLIYILIAGLLYLALSGFFS